MPEPTTVRDREEQLEGPALKCADPVECPACVPDVPEPQGQRGVRILQDPDPPYLLHTSWFGSPIQERARATPVRCRGAVWCRSEIRVVRGGVSVRIPWLVLLTVFTLVGSAPAESLRGLTVASEQRCSSYDRKHH